MFNYTIYSDNSPLKFKEACFLIEKLYPNAVKKKLLVDVDGTTIQTYSYNGKDIDVYDDYDVGAVFVKSEVNLNSIFFRN